MKEIKMSWVAKLQYATMRLFAAQDEDYPDGRAVSANERAIQHYLNLMTNDINEQRKIHDVVQRNNWNTKDLTYKPICDELRAMGFVIKEGV